MSGDHNKHQSGICERCLKHVTDHGVHTCTPTKGWRELEQQRDELLAALENVKRWSPGSEAIGICERAIASVQKEK